MHNIFLTIESVKYYQVVLSCIMVCKGIIKYTLRIPNEFTEDHVDMRREIITCGSIECQKSRGKHTITERCWRY